MNQNELIGKRYMDFEDSGDLVMEVVQVEKDIVYVQPLDKAIDRTWMRDRTRIEQLVKQYEEA